MPEFRIDSGLPVYPAGLTDADAGLMLPVYRAINSMAQQLSALTGSVQYTQGDMTSLGPYTGLRDGSLNRVFVQAGETLVYGHIVNLYVDGGILKARKADALLLRPAHGIVDAPAGIAADSKGEIILMHGRGAGMAGTTLGTTYYLSTGGTVQSTAPNVDGVLNQVVGVGLDTGGIFLAIMPIARIMTNFAVTTSSVTDASGTTTTYTARIQFANGAVVDVVTGEKFVPAAP